MNADIPPLKVWIKGSCLGSQEEYEHGYAFAIQSYKGRALQFHVLLESGAHFRHVPLHWLLHDVSDRQRLSLSLPLLQLWDCFSYRPVVTVFDMLKGYQCDCILKDENIVQGTYWFTVDWLPDSDAESGFLLQPDQNKCAHVIMLDNGQVAALPTNRILWKDAYFIGNKPDAIAKRYTTTDTIHQAEDCHRWSVANTDETFY
ncbi:MAG: hypothetical protein ACK5XN_28955 [Bacteroidota bacterium]